jgi:subfamily B ATP-binding cassette protein MsbA
MSTKKSPLFDVQLFKDLLNYIRPYKVVFIGSIIFVVGLAIFGALRPYVLKEAVDVKISVKDYNGFLTYIVIMIGLLMLEAIFQVLFIYSAAWLGQSVVRDIRVKLFKKILSFKMAYYDKSSVGVLITRTVTDMERIADIFGQGLFMIVSDILKMTVVAGIMIFMNWKLSLIVFTTLPLILLATKIFQKYMKMAFQEVRNEIANLNSFVQERIVGMKILQVFSRETIEMERFNTINNKHKKGWLKTVWYNSIFFPIAEILSSLTLGAVIWFGGINSVVSNLSTQGELFAFIMMIPMMFRPLNQIANKFNTLQMGMVAADRVFKVLNTQSKISNKGDYSPKNVSGNIAFKKVQFSYKEGEPVINDFTLDIKSGETYCHCWCYRCR